MVLCLANFSIAIDVAFLWEDNLAALVVVLEEAPSHLVERTLSDGPNTSPSRPVCAKSGIRIRSEKRRHHEAFSIGNCVAVLCISAVYLRRQCFYAQRLAGHI